MRGPSVFDELYFRPAAGPARPEIAATEKPGATTAPAGSLPLVVEANGASG